MATKTDIELKIVDSVDTSHTDEEVLADSASNPDAFYVGRGYLAHNGEKVIESIDEKGTYPNVTVGNATKATTADTATRANTAATAATAVNISDAPVLTATEDEQITVKVGNKTSNALTVPYAQRADFATDLSGRVEATPEVFTYRPSAGDKSIKDDNAFIRRVKGNSVVFNQFSLVEGEVSISGTDSTKYLTYPTTNTIPKGHKVYISAAIKITDGFDAYNVIVGLSYYNAFYGGELGVVNYQNLTTSYKYFSTIVESLNDRNSGIALRAQSATTGIVYFKDVIAIDLTQMFGTGNEPTTVEEFRALYPNSYYPYNAGELRNLDCYGIKTVGFNQWDGTTQVGYIDDKTGVITSSSSYLCTDFIRVIPNQEYYINTEQTNGRWGAWYDANKNYVAGILNYDQVYTAPANAAYVRLTIKTANSGNPDTFCINLHHTGYRDGDYEPYKEVTHALPLSQITNGEPLRKAGGDVYDEVNNDYYIRRVGVRSYTTGDKDDAALLTDGTYTNYPLDEPIYTPITIHIDFNYNVEDFGTEEALLADDSAPFSADIVYQFNATDQVRNNSRAIKWLKKSAFIPSGTTAQYIRGDGSYADVSELANVIPIYDGEKDSPEESEYGLEIRLFPQQYARPSITLDADNNGRVLIRMEAPDKTDFVAEYWLELEIGKSIPDLTFENPENEETLFRFNGDIQTYAVNIWHIITTDGGMRYFGEIKSYLIE